MGERQPLGRRAIYMRDGAAVAPMRSPSAGKDPASGVADQRRRISGRSPRGLLVRWLRPRFSASVPAPSSGALGAVARGAPGAGAARRVWCRPTVILVYHGESWLTAGCCWPLLGSPRWAGRTPRSAASPRGRAGMAKCESGSAAACGQAPAGSVKSDSPTAFVIVCADAVALRHIVTAMGLAYGGGPKLAHACYAVSRSAR